jgi:hypothetical protein
MALTKRSKFYYDFAPTQLTNLLDFDEGSGELTATIRPTKYTATTLAIEIARAMTEVGTQEYFVSFNRVQRKYTISADASFSLLVDSGTSAASVFPLIGFTGVDRTGLDSYQGESNAGKVFLPQFVLQDYVDFEDEVGFASSTVKKTATGRVEVVSFGQESFASFNIKYQTDYAQQVGSPIDNNPSGVNDLREFLSYAITKGDFEFMPDRDDESTFTKCLLESTPESKDGVKFKLKELYGEGNIGYFQSGKLTLRKVD